MAPPAAPESPPTPETTLVVILGASTYPRKPVWSNPVLGTSATAFRDYVVSSCGMSVPVKQVLNLFDDELPAAKQCEHVEAFLQESGYSRDLIVYYIGHGCFDEEEYYLGVRDTAEHREFLTAIESRKIARIIRERFGRKRVYVILDSCFAASAARDWQGTVLDAAVKRMSRPLPRRGTAFLAASSKDNVTLAPRSTRYTVFTGALLHSLERGIANNAERISLYDLYEEIRDLLNEQENLGKARPELHAPRQEDGDISRLPLFPNKAYRVWRRVKEEDGQHVSLTTTRQHESARFGEELIGSFETATTAERQIAPSHVWESEVDVSELAIEQEIPEPAQVQVDDTVFLHDHRIPRTRNATIVIGALALASAVLFLVVSYTGDAGREAAVPQVADAAAQPDAAEPPIDAPSALTRDEIVARSRFGFFSLTATATTQIYIDNRQIGETPLTRLPLLPGSHKVKAIGPRGQIKQISITIYGGQDTDEGTITW